MIKCGELSVLLQIASKNQYIPPENKIIKWFNIISHDIDIKHKNITLRITEETEIRELNKQFRGKGTSTNVLSFTSQIPRDIDPDYLGDIVICAPVVEREAMAQNKTIESHWAHMLLHGVLHLIGHDHLQAEEALKMEALEVQILAGMGYASPYE